MENEKSAPYVLGLDVGANSIGWALLSVKGGDQENPEPDGIINMGVRVFEAGVEGDIEKGKDVSRAVDRRTARLIRRQAKRRARRLNKLFNILRHSGLLPPFDAVGPASSPGTVGAHPRVRPLGQTHGSAPTAEKPASSPGTVGAHPRVRPLGQTHGSAPTAEKPASSPGNVGPASSRMPESRLQPGDIPTKVGTPIVGAASRRDDSPSSKEDSPQKRHQYFLALDESIRNRLHEAGIDFSSDQRQETLPYFLRARALDHKLEPYELGRALYHLAQRRGFQSNRKASGKKKEEEGAVKAGIAELEKNMAENHSRTLGEYFSGLNPEQYRIRGHWTSRKMYRDEFGALWDAQLPHHPGLLTEALKTQIYKAIFDQRPLKSQKKLVGYCELEHGCRRAPWAWPEVQRFRLLQSINNAWIVNLQGEKLYLGFPWKTNDNPIESKQYLGAEISAELIRILETEGDIEVKDLKTKKKYKHLGFQDCYFSLERGGEKKFPGNKTISNMIKVFGDDWHEFPDQEKQMMLESLMSFQDHEVLAKWAAKRWDWDEKKAEDFAKIRLQDGHCNLSRRAIKKLLPWMERGATTPEAVFQVYEKKGSQTLVKNPLPPIKIRKWPSANDEIPELRNPAVFRVLTELRKLINAIVKKYGNGKPPEKIHIELARELKQNREVRASIWQTNRKREEARDEAKKKIIEGYGIEHPSREDILKYQLAEECGWECPYTGKRISPSNLFGRNAQFDIEHIIPFSRCLDDSYLNKTLCFHEVNRGVKRNKTPFEAFGGDQEKWDEILLRIRKFKEPAGSSAFLTRSKRGGRSAKKKGNEEGLNPIASEKLKRFKLEWRDDPEFFEDFTSRQLNDTRYASKLAKKYVGLLYGPDADKHVKASTGQITNHLRNLWELNIILGQEGAPKSRDDHRQHAIDALVIALTDMGIVKRLSDAAKNAPRSGSLRGVEFPVPWEGFLDQTRAAVDQIIVSRRLSKKVDDPLHKATLYSKTFLDENEKPYVHLRKKLTDLSKSDLKIIVDKEVRRKVEEKHAELGGGDPEKVFSVPENLPYIESKKGKQIPIKKVRIRQYENTTTIGTGSRERHVLTESNHHVVILEIKNEKDNTKWIGDVVKTLDAKKRLIAKEPIIKRDHGSNATFQFSLAIGESVQMEEKGTIGVFHVGKISQNAKGQITIGFRANVDARQAMVSKKEKEEIQSSDQKQPSTRYVFRSPDSLRESMVNVPVKERKVVITPLGEIRNAND